MNKKINSSKFFIIIVILVSIIRFLLSFRLPSFYIHGLIFDDELMISEFFSIMNKNYLGNYNYITLTKGPFYPFLLALCAIYKIRYSLFFTLVYILSSLFFVNSLQKIIKDKKFILIVYILILFNPVSYSSDLFQRLYRNSIVLSELLLFLGFVIRIISDNSSKIYNYIFLGLITSLMFLTREDSIWSIVVICLIIIYKLYKQRKISKILITFIPLIILFINLNLVSFINYKKYGIYTYNEMNKSEFSKTYIKLLQIKDKDKISMVSLPKSTLIDLSKKSKKLGIDEENIKGFFEKSSDFDGEISNGSMMWFFRGFIYKTFKFKNGKESEKYYKELGKEIDELFLKKEFEKEFVIPSVLINTPIKKDLHKIPTNLLKAIIYTTKYENVKTLTRVDEYKYNKEIRAYSIIYEDFNKTENIVQKNPIKYEIFRIIYKYFTIIFSIISLIIYIYNVKKLDKLNLINHIIFISYCIMLLGVVYTHTTGFYAIRYFYLGNIYILQNVFILLNIYRIFSLKKEIYEGINNTYAMFKRRKNN